MLVGGLLLCLYVSLFVCDFMYIYVSLFLYVWDSARNLNMMFGNGGLVDVFVQNGLSRRQLAPAGLRFVCVFLVGVTSCGVVTFL